MPSYHLLSSIYVLVTFAAAAAAQGRDMICMTDPDFKLNAGDVARARISSPTARKCQATLSFVDENFLPVHFNVRGTACEASLEVELAITIPNEVPNGEAYLAWVCAGDATPSCAGLYLTGGESDAEKLEYTQAAVLSCVPPQSTFSTMTRGAATQSFSLQSKPFTHSTWTSTITSVGGTLTATLAIVTGDAAATESTSTDAASLKLTATKSAVSTESSGNAASTTATESATSTKSTDDAAATESTSTDATSLKLTATDSASTTATEPTSAALTTCTCT